MSALRLARAFTGRDKLVKCVGGYHGHSDGLLVEAGSGAMTLGVPSSPGVPRGMTADTLLMPYNDLEAARQLFAEHAAAIAAVCVEPIAGNMGCVPPRDDYLAGLRKLCDDHGTLLVFDEVMTGFRVSYGGAQKLYGITPDLTALGKVMGGGLPCAAYGGREQVMRQVAPDGPVYQAGTLSGNPLAMAAGMATLEELREEGVYRQLDQAGAAVEEGLAKAAKKADVPVTVQRVGSMLTAFFIDRPVVNYDDAAACDTHAFATFFGAMLDRGVVLPPSQFEAWFLGTAHDAQAIEQIIDAAKAALKEVAKATD
jgi:glutamate-1-semialdehyde 2,1-aminomutase